MPSLQKFASFLAGQYLRFVYVTTRWVHLYQEIPNHYVQEKKPFIACFWHGRLAMIGHAWVWKDRPFHMLLSAHRDGQMIAQAVSYIVGAKFISGSTQRGGTEALRRLLKVLRQGEPIGITPDGPRGPRQVVSPGTLAIARLGAVDMIPVTYSISRKVRLNTWDGFLLPLPFGRGVFFWGEPISAPSSNDPEDIERARLHLENAMTTLQDAADEMVKG